MLTNSNTKYLLPYIVLILFSCSCKQSSDSGKKIKAVRDTSISVTNAFTPKFLDSTDLETFLQNRQLHDSVASRLREFYAKRNYQYAWFTDSGFVEYGQGFSEMLNNYLAYSKDSTLFDQELRSLIDSFSINEHSTRPATEFIKTELLLSTQFFRYAHRVYEGRNGLDQKDLGWFIPKKKVDPVAVLDSMISVRSSRFETYEPLNPQYHLLKNQLIKYYTLQNELDSLRPIELLNRKDILDFSKNINLKKHLVLLGDLSTKASASKDSDSVIIALKRFQNRHGLSPTDVVNQATANCFNEPSDSRIKQMLINLERLKWVPLQPSSDYLLVNIPEFRLHAFDNGQYMWSMKVVVGTDANSTVIFSGNLKYVVFSPYWNIPRSILKKEILPGISRNKNYLAQHKMEWNGGNVRQKPGPRNSLGLVKFLFPNSYNIYLHDTPSKSLFNESKRAFSHGCIRLEKPTKLASFLLRNDSSWNSDKIAQAMNAGKENYVTLRETIPVFIGYFTSWVDQAGVLNFRDDIYGHDKKMAEKLFIKD